MSDLHLVISRPAPGEWLGRMDIVEALEAAGWRGDEDMPLSVLRHPSGAIWGVTDSGDSGLDCPNGAVVSFPADTPSIVVIAACLASVDVA
jgi:hypothetical protein